VAAIRAALHRSRDGDRMAAALATMRSPLARRITELELSGSSPDAQPELRGFAARLQNAPPAATRLAAVRRLDGVSGATSLSLESLGALLHGLVTGMAPSMPAARRPSPGDVDALVAQTLKQTEPALRAATEVSLLFAYRSLSDAELEEYVAQSESEPMQWFFAALRGAFVDTIRRGSAEFGRKLSLVIGPGA
jgi:hypothetical protein